MPSISNSNGSAGRALHPVPARSVRAKVSVGVIITLESLPAGSAFRVALMVVTVLPALHALQS